MVKQIAILCTALTLYAQQDLNIRLMTYNIRRKGPEQTEERTWKRRTPLVVTCIQEIAPDIIGMQEPTKEQIDDLAQALPDYQAIGKGRGESWWGRGKDEYNPIFYNNSRFELLAHDTFSINQPGGLSNYLPWITGWLPRICTWARLKDTHTGQQFYLYNTHFDHTFARAQQTCAQAIADHINTHATDAPVIITGDFNTPFTDEIKQILHQFVHTKEIATCRQGPDDTRTGWDDEQLKEIDHILVLQQQATVDTYAVVQHDEGVYPSDHRPVWADITLLYK